MPSDLLKAQWAFTWRVGLLISYAYARGYRLTFGDAWAKDGHKQGSFHYKRLAIDLNLFNRAGEYLQRTEDHKPLGLFWEKLGGTWGGRWGDGNHYSWGE